jgi:hypothetical protein
VWVEGGASRTAAEMEGGGRRRAGGAAVGGAESLLCAGSHGISGGCRACSPILAYSCISVSFFIISSILAAQVTSKLAENTNTRQPTIFGTNLRLKMG